MSDDLERERALRSAVERRAAAWRSELIATESELASTSRELAQVRHELGLVRQQMDNVHELVAAMETTVSWRVTQPLRAVRRRSARRAVGPAADGGRFDGGTVESAVPVAIVRRRSRPDGDAASAHVVTFLSRLRTILQFLDPAAPRVPDIASGLDAFERATDAATLEPEQLAWLACCVATGVYPNDVEFDGTLRTIRRGGAIGARIADLFVAASGERDRLPEIEVVQGRVLVDVTHTTMWDLHTGIQRVTKEVAARWLQRDDAVLVHFNEDDRSLKVLDDAERARALRWRDHMHEAGEDATRRIAVERSGATIIPWRCTHLIPELVDSDHRVRAYTTLRAGRVLVGQSLIGYDTIPATGAEFTAMGVPEAFARYFALLKGCSALSAISHAAAEDFGWMFHTLGSQGLTAPTVTATPLPSVTGEVTQRHLDEARESFRLTSLPLVLVVGSHEPRKNHLSILEAAEKVWGDGREFELLFVGGASWGRQDFAGEVQRAVDAGWPIQVYRRVSEESLWALYHLAAFSVFVSLLEGYGLPVAESLSCGTPVITSAYGSMAEVAAGGGAVTVDPRDVGALADAMGRLLTDDAELDELRAAAQRRKWPTWDDYADELWVDLVERVAPDAER